MAMAMVMMIVMVIVMMMASPLWWLWWWLLLHDHGDPALEVLQRADQSLGLV